MITEGNAESPPMMLIMYAPVDAWLALVAAGWSLPWIVAADRSGWAVLLERGA
jgi:hypothetical protein